MPLLYQKTKPQTKKPPDWVTSLGDYDEKEKFGISLNKGYSMKIEIRLDR